MNHSEKLFLEAWQLECLARNRLHRLFIMFVGICSSPSVQRKVTLRTFHLPNYICEGSSPFASVEGWIFELKLRRRFAVMARHGQRMIAFDEIAACIGSDYNIHSSRDCALKLQHVQNYNMKNISIHYQRKVDNRVNSRSFAVVGIRRKL